MKSYSYQDLLKIIHKEGYVFIICFVAMSFLLGSFNTTLGWIGFIATMWCVYFFRDPVRIVPMAKGLVVSPADGVIQNITEVAPPPELGLGEETMSRISIFLNIFNVHVNRIPISGKILSLNYYPGKFFNASLDKASIYNERQSVLMETEEGKKIIFVQIAGLIARRIVCDLEEGEKVKKGDRFGIIRFGSRVDVYLPINTVISVSVGQTAIGGETILADFNLAQNSNTTFEKK